MRFEAALSILVLLAAPALAKDADVPKTDPKTLVATGKSRQCLPLRDIQQSKPAGEDVIMFRTGANRWYRNDLRAPCANLKDDRVLVFRVAASSVCELDTVDLVDPLSRVNFGFCALGRFTPVEVPKGTRF